MGIKEYLAVSGTQNTPDPKSYNPIHKMITVKQNPDSKKYYVSRDSTDWRIYLGLDLKWYGIMWEWQGQYFDTKEEAEQLKAQKEFSLLPQKETTMKETLQFAVENNFNVLLRGTHGVGKTQGTLALWEENGLRAPEERSGRSYLYLNTPILDVHEDFRGIPINQDGKMVYITPEHRHFNEVEFILIDEPNRAHPKVAMACYELAQFKSINGKRLPKLRAVWTALNPDDGDYTVETLDQSFFDRFEIHLHVLPELNEEYFTQKLGMSKDIFDQTDSFWKAIPEKVRTKFASPRRMEYAWKVFSAGGKIEHVLPLEVNPGKLQPIFSGVKPTLLLDGAMSVDTARSVLENAGRMCEKYGFNIFMGDLMRVPTEVAVGYFTYSLSTAEVDKDRQRRFLLDTCVKGGTWDNDRLLKMTNVMAKVPNLLVAIVFNTPTGCNYRALEILKKDFSRLASSLNLACI